MEYKDLELEYKDLEKVNSELVGIDVKGKEYVEVNKRIIAFRKLFPKGTIETNIVSIENGMCIIRACVSVGGVLLATGYAYEKEGSSFINKTSYIENCETSAIGRALGMLGIGIETSVASAEEVQNAMLQQENEKLITQTMCDMLTEKAKQMDIEEVKSILAQYHIKKISDIKLKNFKEIAEKMGCKQ